MPFGTSAPVAVLLFWLTASPTAQQLSVRLLALHHLLHWLQFAAGLVLSANWPGRPLRRRPGLAAAVVSAALAYVLVVHLPLPLDAAVSLPALHAALHLGFAVAGAATAIAWRDVGEFARVLIVVLTMGAMTVLSLAEITGSFAYSAYPSGQEAASGIVMLAGMGLFWVALAFADVPDRLSRAPHPVIGGVCAGGLAALIAASYLAA